MAFGGHGIASGTVVGVVFFVRVLRALFSRYALRAGPLPGHCGDDVEDAGCVAVQLRVAVFNLGVFQGAAGAIGDVVFAHVSAACSDKRDRIEGEESKI